MKTIEDFITHECRLDIGMSGCVPSARLVSSNTKVSVQVSSDRGIDHLLLILLAEMTKDENQKQSILDQAEKKYINNIYMSEIDIFVRKHLIRVILKTETWFIVTAKTNVAPSISDPPGQYKFSIESDSIISALEAFVSGKVKSERIS
jgi:hypothetical protein